MNTVSACGTHAQPVLDLVLVQNQGTLHSHGLTGKPVTELLQIPSSWVLASWLHYNPPKNYVIWLMHKKEIGSHTRTCDF